MPNPVEALAPFTLTGKVAFVTGAASGLGIAIAKLFLEVGASVVLADLNEAGAKAVAEELRVHGPTLGIGCDVSNEASVIAAFQATAEEFGGVDILVNNAAYRKKTLTMDMSVEEWDMAHAVIARGAFLCLRQAAIQMRARGGGSIVNVTTVSAHHPSINRNMHYDSAKAGSEAIVRHAALDFAPDKIRVNWVAPGAMLTPGGDDIRALMSESPGGPATQPGRYPLDRKAEPVEMARAVLFLASDAASYITGTGIVVDAGFCIG